MPPVKALIALSVLMAVPPQKGRYSQEDYVSEILTLRRTRDEEFASRKWSPLAVVAIAPLDKKRTTIGSGAKADLKLDAEDVAPIHAEILREQDSAGRRTFRLRAVAGQLWTDVNPPEEIRDINLELGTRIRIGRFLVYWDNLGTFGPVVRALDYTSTAFTHFKGLKYFPPDPSFRVSARIMIYPKAEKVMVADTQGWKRPAWRYGEASFKLKGMEYRLVLLVFNPSPGPQDKFFIAFTDETRGSETYPAARYLETPFVTSGPLTLDFNLATNPLCAYNKGFACPLAPRENRLAVAIQAGEKLYPDAVGH